MASVPHIVALVLEGLLMFVMAIAVYSFFTGQPAAIEKSHAALNFPGWFWQLARGVAVVGLILLVAGFFAAALAGAAAFWMVCYFIVASGAHVVRSDWANLGLAVFFLAMSVVFLILRWGDAQTLLKTVGL